ncbi:unnamed protein product [Symbiodinium sp. CCMP2592]|nr:unnamed protein product [Symbiodinium sp. CCMP2592]
MPQGLLQARWRGIGAAPPTQPPTKLPRTRAETAVPASQSVVMTEPCSDKATKPKANMSKGKQQKTKDAVTTTERSGHEKKSKGILSQLDKARAKRARQKRRKMAREKAKTKDPEEASSYLAAWKAHQDSGTAWRFNKATQAWLLRHAYEPEMVPKKVFQLLLRYLAGLSGAARDRAVAEAGALVTLQGAEVPKAGATQSKSVRSKRSRKAKALLLHDVIFLSEHTFRASGLCGTLWNQFCSYTSS